MNGWMDGWMDGWMEREMCLFSAHVPAVRDGETLTREGAGGLIGHEADGFRNLIDGRKDAIDGVFEHHL